MSFVLLGHHAFVLVLSSCNVVLNCNTMISERACSVDLPGVVSVILGILVLAPFITMCLIGLTHLNFDWMGLDGPDTALAPSPSLPTVIDWGKFLTLLLWNTSGFVLCATIPLKIISLMFE